ncbi:hypothetical protein Bhyg_03117, partial [Pseudolycoriella hygida]
NCGGNYKSVHGINKMGCGASTTDKNSINNLSVEVSEHLLPTQMAMNGMKKIIKSKVNFRFDLMANWEYSVCEISLAIDSDAKPVFCKPRSVPIAWKSKLERNLHDLVEKRVLEQVDTSKWGTPKDNELGIEQIFKNSIN